MNYLFCVNTESFAIVHVVTRIAMDLKNNY